jgi:heme/copper-type cytochrome/quinol oxidase subunit 2
VKPSLLRVEKDDSVRLRVTSEVAGEIHLHGYRLEMKVAPGTQAELQFKAHATGRYRIEWHAAGGAAMKGDHHGPPLATLEVRPK